MENTLIKRGFILAALMNFSVVVFSRGFTNTAINSADPVVMSNFGLLMIVMWGLAYLCIGLSNSSAKWISAVFAVEKLIYVVIWILWHSENSVKAVYSEDILAGVFYSIYGLNDLIFMIFFVWVFYLSSKNKDVLPSTST
ncbi:hypothetical protein HJP15_20060 [Pseudoalteromonas sp. NEC-BIFX-2020_002]|uniref:Uncharacterized protein n=2 Tax=Pseudoalteromonas TaxID=53246 RepID=A0A0N1EPJ0_9GAMM|nr:MULTISPECIES: hypothetical protein [Pseudoalteromonas]KPH63410.1 hypothetical protein ADS77_08950 [Pseudoalteromonas porphyrae]NMR26014.1 hypothetical protein [Pseudoalteromonas sp. NEC-BIFX-2020_015]NNG45183.1 hypothetical protein [Pseudoalteromonas sp. NEC-BIFX-2020_002]